MQRHIIGAASLAVILAVAAPAWADCVDDLRDYNKTVTDQEGYRVGLTPGLRDDLRQLRDSAYVLQSAGQEEACQEVVAAIKDMAENPPKQENATENYEEWNTSEVERLKTAKSLDQAAGLLSADQIIGADIRNPQNEDLGEIDDIVLATAEGESSYAIITHGGFLGMGEKRIAVPMQKLKVTSDRDVFVLNMSEDRLESAPSFDRGQFDQIADESWRKSNEEFFSTTE
ncbi:MAG: PRC-barrel domain-containing protein [Kiloniellales bacterium]